MDPKNRLAAIAAGISDERVRALVLDMLERPRLSFTDQQPRIGLEQSPAAPRKHHFFTGGLLVHTAGVAALALKIADYLEEVYGVRVDRDTVAAAAILHDIFKFYQYRPDEAEGGYRAREDWYLSHDYAVVAELAVRGAPDKLIRAVSEAHGLAPFSTLEGLVVHLADSVDARVGELLQQAMLSALKPLEAQGCKPHKLLDELIRAKGLKAVLEWALAGGGGCSRRPRGSAVLPVEVAKLVDVWKVYRSGQVETPALRGVSLSVERGEYIAIMGPSGSGKSTLLNILGLLDRPSSGRVYVLGRDASGLSSAELAALRNRVIGFVFQRFNLVSRLTVEENVELPLIARGLPRRERKELVAEAIKMAGGDLSWLRKKPNQLSGGQQQRVAIARAIVGRPQLLLADEPTGNLDRASARVVLQTFAKLNEAGLAIVLVTHDPEAANCAQKIYLLRDGRIAGKVEPDRSKCLAA